MRKYVLWWPIHSEKVLRLLLVFISEITARAFIIADSNKRRTLSRSDIAKALSKSDQFDFLIDIVPREEMPLPGFLSNTNGSGGKKTASTATKRETVRLSILFFDLLHFHCHCRIQRTLRFNPMRSLWVRQVVMPRFWIR